MQFYSSPSNAIGYRKNLQRKFDRRFLDFQAIILPNRDRVQAPLHASKLLSYCKMEATGNDLKRINKRA